MTSRRVLRPLLLPALLAAVAGCSEDRPAATAPGPVQGAPIQGAPIDGAPIDAPAEEAPPPVATEPAPTPAPPPGPVAAEGEATAPTEPTDPAAPAPPTTDAPLAGEIPAVGDLAGKDEEPAEPPAADGVPGRVIGVLGPSASEVRTPPPGDPPTPARTAPAGPPADAPKSGASLVPAGHVKGQPFELTWEQLASFEYVPPPPVYRDPETGAYPDNAADVEKARRQIPVEIWELEGHTVTVEGYMIPLEYAEEGVASFLLSRHAMGCCFGVMPRAHELLECTMSEGKSVPYVGYLPVKVTGVLHVGPKDGPQQVMTGIYRMDSPTLEIPKAR